jgi:hypothetical protein
MWINDNHVETILAALDDSMSTRGAMTQDEYDRWLAECKEVVATLQAQHDGATGGDMPDGPLPCPLCGGESVIVFYDKEGEVNWSWYAMCNDMDCGLTHRRFRHRSQAIDAWNKRVEPAAAPVPTPTTGEWVRLTDGTYHTDGPEIFSIDSARLTVYQGGWSAYCDLPYDIHVVKWQQRQGSEDTNE